MIFQSRCTTSHRLNPERMCFTMHRYEFAQFFNPTTENNFKNWQHHHAKSLPRTFSKVPHLPYNHSHWSLSKNGIQIVNTQPQHTHDLKYLTHMPIPHNESNGQKLHLETFFPNKQIHQTQSKPPKSHIPPKATPVDTITSHDIHQKQ